MSTAKKAKSEYVWVSIDDPAIEIRTRDRVRTGVGQVVHAFFYRHGRCFNQCLVGTQWLLANFKQKQTP